ncbi:ribose-phosphate diphosphokinase [Spirochaeta lutea]|uniref:ribose-phosphate diphosphokinase n=1 Tax=Spirochaeta lutea TaxID=1480694 RepID=A0A098QY90_9SPIO|nr:ribose-phosphate diphosphokinase [Spirochaeta lutea]KGE71462.1 ribose-phosphate pyrophosphokinase [Spirochaeta lutea]
MDNLIIVGNIADNPFVADIAQHLSQSMHYSDLISLKSFLNNEFCPRFIVDEDSWENIGDKLAGRTVLIVSSTQFMYSRDELAMRNFLIARAAKDNGAERVFLLEPDLFYSAQDRGPRQEHGFTEFERPDRDYKKFDGQPFSARLYADLLKESGVDEVITVHNHSSSVKRLFMERFSGHFHNLQPGDVFANYIKESDIVDHQDLILCAPDKGALSFVREVHEQLHRPEVPVVIMQKERTGERQIIMNLDPASDIALEDVAGRQVVVIDDMVRTGNTIVECCRKLRQAGASRVVFFVTHFYSSQEGRIKLNDPSIDEIVTTSTIPQILNRDMQGRLRHKMVVLRIARWMSSFLHMQIGAEHQPLPRPLYVEDMSSKNPRWKGGRPGPLFD